MAKKRTGSLGDARARMKQLREADPDEAEQEESAPRPRAVAAISAQGAAPSKAPPKRDKGTYGGRYRTTIYMNRDLYRQAQAAIRDLGDQGEQPSTISQLLDDALARELKRLAKKHRDGVAWEPLPIRSKR